MARPGGNATGFESFEYGIGGKWLQLLKEIAPRLTRIAVFRDASINAGIGQWGAIQTAAPSFGLEVTPINLRDANEIERAVTAFARQGNGGLIVTSSIEISSSRKRLGTSFQRYTTPVASLNVGD